MHYLRETTMIQTQLISTVQIPVHIQTITTGNQLAKHCETVSFKKNEVIKPSHVEAKYGYFLMEGTCRLMPNSEASPIDYRTQNAFFTEADASVLIALEETKLLRIRLSVLNKLDNTPLGKLFFPVE